MPTRDVITRGIRAFMARDWQGARDAKDAYWAERVRRLGPREALRIADELRRQAPLQDIGGANERQPRGGRQPAVRLIRHAID